MTFTRWIDWTCEVESCKHVQTTYLIGEGRTDRVVACARCRTLHVVVTDPLAQSARPVALLHGPSNEAVTIGPVAFQRMHVRPAVELPPRKLDEEGSP